MNATQLLTVKETCDTLRVSRTTLHRLTKRGVISAIRIGRSLRYRESAVEKYLRSNET
jgi:excisionase family DNA binding protein